MAQSQQTMPLGKDQPSDPGQTVKTSDVLVFVEETAVTKSSVRHAQKVASAFGGKVVLVHVLCKSASGEGPIDPVEWDIKKQQCLKQLGFVAEGSDGGNLPCNVELLEGQCISQIKAFVGIRTGDIAASPRPRSDASGLLSETASGVLLSQSAAILMIPDGATIEPNTKYRRILVPLDGSSRAETALPVAIKLAQAENAELIICYALPEPNVTEFGARDEVADRLRTLVLQRNEQAAKSYLTRIAKRIAHNGLKISVTIPDGGDARRALIEAIAIEKADFVVMATHGQSGNKDVPTGDVARFVFDRSEVPVLLVRYKDGRSNNHAFGKVSSIGVRQPAGTD